MGCQVCLLLPRTEGHRKACFRLSVRARLPLLYELGLKLDAQRGHGEEVHHHGQKGETSDVHLHLGLHLLVLVWYDMMWIMCDVCDVWQGGMVEYAYRIV